MRLGMTELLVIFGIAILLFGHRLPGIGKSLGEGIRGFKKGMSEDDDEAPKELGSGEKTNSQRESEHTRQK